MIILQRHSMDSLSNLSTSSIVKHSNTKLSGSVFKALWCSMSMSSVPIDLCKKIIRHYITLRMLSIRCTTIIYVIYLYCNSHHIHIRYPRNIPYPNSLTSWKIRCDFYKNVLNKMCCVFYRRRVFRVSFCLRRGANQSSFVIAID